MADATVHSINISNGGVPKQACLSAHVRFGGLEGDRQRDRRIHGGPERAVSLYSLDRIRALQDEGHPIQPGTTGENLTLAGLAWDDMRTGVRLEIAGVRLELTRPAAPCKTIAGSFRDGDFSRISEKIHPGWSRFYTRVLREGVVHVGDRVSLLRVPDFALRPATLADRGELERLIARSARGLSRGDYTEEQIEAALGSALGVDTQLIEDGTYLVAEAEGEIIGCGGWSVRETLFGGDRQAQRSSRLLDPARDPARIRAFFVRPDWARRGVARALLERCEGEAQARGFRALELVATLPGWPFYRRFGYVGEERRTHVLPGGLGIDFVPMKKTLG